MNLTLNELETVIEEFRDRMRECIKKNIPIIVLNTELNNNNLVYDGTYWSLFDLGQPSICSLKIADYGSARELAFIFMLRDN